MPGVLLIEAMAQTAGWLVIARTKFARMPFLAAVKEAKLRSFVTPGQALALTAKLVHEGSGYAVTKADIRCDGKLTCDAEITFRLVDFPNPEFRASMRRWRRASSSRWRRWLMADAPARGLDHRHRHRLLPWRRADAHWQGLSERRTNAPTPRRFAPYLVHPLGAARFRQADPQEGRPAADGGVAAHRHLRRRACARPCRRQGQRRAARHAWT